MEEGVHSVVSDIHRRFGDTAVVTLADAARAGRGIFSTGIADLDRALGVGGITRGRLTEIFGAESTSKTTLALHMAAEAQKSGPVVFIDGDHAVDPRWAERCGIDEERALLVSTRFFRTSI